MSSSSSSGSSSSSRFHRPAGVSQFHSHRPELLPERRAKTLFVGNLDKRISEYHLIKLFSPFGSLARVQFFWHHYGEKAGQPRSFAFVEFEQQPDAEDAIDQMNGAKVCGKIIVVSKMKENTEELMEGGFRMKKTHQYGGENSGAMAGMGMGMESGGEQRTLLDELREGKDNWTDSEKIHWIQEKLNKMKLEREQARLARQAFSLSFFDQHAPSQHNGNSGTLGNSVHSTSTAASSSDSHHNRSAQDGASHSQWRYRSSRSRSPSPSRHSSSRKAPRELHHRSRDSDRDRERYNDRGHDGDRDRDWDRGFGSAHSHSHSRAHHHHRPDRSRSPRRDRSQSHHEQSSASSSFQSSHRSNDSRFSSHRSDRHYRSRSPSPPPR